MSTIKEYTLYEASIAQLLWEGFLNKTNEKEYKDIKDAYGSLEIRWALRQKPILQACAHGANLVEKTKAKINYIPFFIDNCIDWDSPISLSDNWNQIIAKEIPGNHKVTRNKEIFKEYEIDTIQCLWEEALVMKEKGIILHNASQEDVIEMSLTLMNKEIVFAASRGYHIAIEDEHLLWSYDYDFIPFFMEKCLSWEDGLPSLKENWMNICENPFNQEIEIEPKMQ